MIKVRVSSLPIIDLSWRFLYNADGEWRMKVLALDDYMKYQYKTGWDLMQASLEDELGGPIEMFDEVDGKKLTADEAKAIVQQIVAKGTKMTDQETPVVNEAEKTIEMSQEEAALFAAPATEPAADAPAVTPPKPKFYSIAVGTAVNKVHNLRVFYVETLAKRFVRQAQIMGVVPTVVYLQSEKEENELLELARQNPRAGTIQLDTNPAEAASTEEEPTPTAGFGPSPEALKSQKAHGKELSAEEAAKVREELGLAPAAPPAPTEAEEAWLASLETYRRNQWRGRFAAGLTAEQREYLNSQVSSEQTT